jgi:hypothetical protein
MAGSDGGPLGVFVFLTEREGKERGRRQEEEGDGARVSLCLGCGIKGGREGAGAVVELGEDHRVTLLACQMTTRKRGLLSPEKLSERVRGPPKLRWLGPPGWKEKG